VTEHHRAIVKIEQPTANKVTVFLIAAAAGFLTLVLLTKIEADGFKALLLVFLIGVLLYSYRAIQVVAIADADGIDVRNLIRNRRFPWSKVDVLSVGKAGSGPGTGITVELVDGSAMPIEASWGTWYQGKESAANTMRCERFIGQINAMRSYDPDLDGHDDAPPIDPIVVRRTEVDDVDAVAETIDAAWRETYDEILPGQVFNDRDPADDAAMLRDLLDGAIPGAGSLVVERFGEIVGASVFGPTQADGLEGYIEIYMIYVRAAEIGSGVGWRLVVRTLGSIRESGARGVVGHVYVNNRSLRNRIERMGIQPHGKPQEQIWYGLPIRVIEYRMSLKSNV